MRSPDNVTCDASACPCIRPDSSTVTLATKIIERTRLDCLDGLQFHPQNGQHGQQLARTKFGQPAPLETRKHFLTNTCKSCHLTLLQAE